MKKLFAILAITDHRKKLKPGQPKHLILTLNTVSLIMLNRSTKHSA